MLLFIILYKVVLTFEPLGKILKCDHSVESYLAPETPAKANITQQLLWSSCVVLFIWVR